MNTNEQIFEVYEAPQVEVVEVAVEQGFLDSTLPNGGNPFQQ